MGTRSRIAIKTAKEIKSIYCHWDGYLSGNGEILLHNYTNEKKVSDLIKLGSLSSLHESIEKPYGHTFDTPIKGFTVAYGRDRGETDVKVIKHSSIPELVDYFKSADDEQYLYLFDTKENEWKYQKPDSKKWMKVTEKNVIEK